MAEKVRWGVLGVAGIATGKVIPAMQKGKLTEVVAIASREARRAKDAARKLGIPKSYGSYEELLRDPEIDAIYIPLPNHLHVAWTTKAIEAGKHVLCEKPLSTNVQDLKKLIRTRDKSGLKVGEAFMAHTHPQWIRAKEIAHSTSFGELRAVLGFFSYNLTDPKNIRNKRELGGGGLFDIGVYPVHTSRFVLGTEPRRVAAAIEWDPVMKIDRLTSVILEFPNAQATFMCATQTVPFQRMHFFGTKARVEVEIPFNAPNDRKCRLFVDSGELTGAGVKTIELAICDQYTIQGDAFSKAILSGGEVPVPLEDSLANAAVIDAIFQAAKSGKWEKVQG